MKFLKQQCADGEQPAKNASSKTTSKTIYHRGTEDAEFYFVNCAVGAVNNKSKVTVFLSAAEGSYCLHAI